MAPIADVDGEVYPILTELLHYNDTDFPIPDDDDSTHPPEEPPSAPTGPQIGSTSRSTIQQRKHRAGRQVKARRLRAQLRLGTKFSLPSTSAVVQNFFL